MPWPSGDFAQQPFRFLLQRKDIGTYLGEGAELRRLVEVAG